MPPLKAQLLLEESLSAYFPEMVFTDSGITVQLHRNTQIGSVAQVVSELSVTSVVSKTAYESIRKVNSVRNWEQKS